MSNEKQIFQGEQPCMLVRKYRSEENDLAWARNGLVATVINGESILLLQ